MGGVLVGGCGQPNFEVQVQSAVGPVPNLVVDGEHGFVDGGGSFDGGVCTIAVVGCVVGDPANTGVPATRRREERARTDVSDFIVIPFCRFIAARSCVAG